MDIDWSINDLNVLLETKHAVVLRLDYKVCMIFSKMVHHFRKACCIVMNQLIFLIKYNPILYRGGVYMPPPPPPHIFIQKV